jgi:hypothetical protein
MGRLDNAEEVNATRDLSLIPILKNRCAMGLLHMDINIDKFLNDGCRETTLQFGISPPKAATESESKRSVRWERAMVKRRGRLKSPPDGEECMQVLHWLRTQWENVASFSAHAKLPFILIEYTGPRPRVARSLASWKR